MRGSNMVTEQFKGFLYKTNKCNPEKPYVSKLELGTKLRGQYKDVNEFDAGFKVSDEMIQDLISQGEKAGVKYNEEQYKISKNVIDYILKSLVARDVFDQEAFTIIYNKRNDLLKEGLRVINDDKLYNSLLKSTE